MSVVRELASIKKQKLGRPKEILINAINEHLLERMNSLGYKFSESQLKFKRKKGDFSQEVWFRGSKTNWGEEFIDFQYQFVIQCSKYKRFKKELGEKIYSSSGIVQGNRESLKNWDRSRESGFGYDFVKMNHQEIMDDIYNNVINTGEQYFSSSDSLENIAINGQGIEKIDFQIIMGNYVEAERVYSDFSQKYNEMNEQEKLKNKQLMDLWKKKINYINQRNTDVNK